MKTMKDRLDLDVWSSDQIETTRELDKKGEHLYREMCLASLVVMNEMITVLSQLPIPLWQRICYEKSLQSDSDPDCKQKKAMANMMWFTVDFIQKCTENSRQLIAETMKAGEPFGPEGNPFFESIKAAMAEQIKKEEDER